MGAITKEAKPSAPPAPVRATKVDDLGALDGIRALCCLLIVIGHTADVSLSPISGDTSVLQVDITMPVTLFFLLSGITLTRLYIVPKKVHSGYGVWMFYRKRFGRLAPSYYLGLALGVYLALCTLAQGVVDDTASYAVTPFFLQSVVPFVIVNGRQVVLLGLTNAPLWQVSVFWFGYVSFPLVGRVSAALPAWVVTLVFTVMLLVVALIVQFLPAQNALLNGAGMMMLSHISVVTRLPHFIGGVLMGDLIERARTRKTPLDSNGLDVTEGAGVSLQVVSQPRWVCIATDVLSALDSNGLDVTEGAGVSLQVVSQPRWVCIATDVLSAALVLWYVFIAILGYSVGNFIRDAITHMSQFWAAPLLGLWLGLLILSENGPYRTLTSRCLRRIPQILSDCGYVVYCIHWPMNSYYTLLMSGGNRLPVWHLPFMVGMNYVLGMVLLKVYDRPLRDLLQGSTRPCCPKIAADTCLVEVHQPDPITADIEAAVNLDQIGLGERAVSGAESAMSLAAAPQAACCLPNGKILDQSPRPQQQLPQH